MIVWFLMLAVAVWMAQKYSLEHGLDELEYEMEPEKMLAEPDEPIWIHMTVRNKKWLLVPFLQIREELPDGVRVYELEKGKLEKTEGVYQRYWLETELYLAGWQKAEITRKISCAKRGCYGFKGATLSAGDFLGVSGRSQEITQYREIVIKPKPATNSDLNRILGGFLGDISVRRFWMEDPMFLSGFREYTGREPFRAISWTQSARSGKMMVKEYDHTAELSCLVLLDISCRQSWEKNLDSETETCFSITRSVCETLEKQGFSYEFFTNAIITGPVGNISRVLEGRGMLHLQEVLEILGRSTYHFGKHLDELLKQIEMRRSAGKACILISLEEAKECSVQIQHLREMTGHEILVLTPQGEE